MQSTKPVIAVHNLTKCFGKFKALDALSLSVEPGEVHGFLGPNGAGKSTTLRIILGLLRKDSGDISLFNQDPWNNSVDLHKRLAYIPGDVSVWPSLTGGEAIDLLGSLRGGYNTKRRAQLIDLFDFDPTKKCTTYSKGNRQKVAIIAALASDVELYLMDEPTSGLDPLMQAVFNKEVLQLKKSGCTVLLSSHVLAEVETLCDRVTIIKEGRTIESGTLSDMRRLALTNISVTTEKPIKGLGDIKGLHNIHTEEGKTTLSAESASLDQLMRHLSEHTILTFTATPPTLDELFLRHYSGESSAK